MAKKKKVATKKKVGSEGVRKVSKKKRSTQTYKWIKQQFAELDEIKERLALIEWFLGGRESMEKVRKYSECN